MFINFWRRDTRNGFTLVELLIVIVVIAIIATISVMSYKGTVARASNTRTVTIVNHYYKSIQLYKSLTGAYPMSPGEGSAQVTLVCLGLGYKNGKCGIISDTQVRQSKTFMDDLQAKSGYDLSAIVNDRYGAVGGESFTGAMYGIDVVASGHTSTGRGRVIEWIMEGTNQNCGIAGSWAYNSASGNTACELNFEDY